MLHDPVSIGLSLELLDGIILCSDFLGFKYSTASPIYYCREPLYIKIDISDPELFDKLAAVVIQYTKRMNII